MVRKARVRGHEFKYYGKTVPEEVIDKRQQAVKAYVENFKREDQQVRGAMSAAAGTFAATTAAGVITATQFHGEPVAPGAGAGYTSATQDPPVVQLQNQPLTGAGQIANQGATDAYTRRNGKQLPDYFERATPAYRFLKEQRNLAGTPSDQVKPATRVDNYARVNNHDLEGRPIDGRGSNIKIFGRTFRAPKLPLLNNFLPVDPQT